jgi:RND family efflux transporter MFP subunit
VAQTKSQLAQAGIAGVQSGLHSINAPYAGVVSEVLVEAGDMALPGQPLVRMYDASEMRVVVNVPQSQLALIKQQGTVKVVVGAAKMAENTLNITQYAVLPTVDPITNTVKLRLALPKNLKTIAPGMFARATLPLNSEKGKVQLYIPIKAVIKRSELVAVYVLDAQGRPQLRQVKLGRIQGENVEVFAGLQLGETLAEDPIAAANYK